MEVEKMQIYKDDLIISFSVSHSSSPGQKTARSRTVTYALRSQKYTAAEYDQLCATIRADLPGKESSQLEYDRTTIPLIAHQCPCVTIWISEEEYQHLKEIY